MSSVTQGSGAESLLSLPSEVDMRINRAISTTLSLPGADLDTAAEALFHTGEVEQSKSTGPRIVDKKERRELIEKCQKLKRQVVAATGGSRSNASSPRTMDDDTKALLNEYRVLKQVVRDSFAAQIQAVYRGFRARKPMSSCFSRLPINYIAWVLESLRNERKRKGRPHHIHQMSFAQLKEEKHDIKLILVGFDRAFRRKFGRLPTKAEKEKFRPIYQVYNEVKKLLSANPEAKVVSQKRKEADATIAALRKEKRALQIKLNKFEHSFRSEHGRNIMWESDILPVRQDYERYKALKRQLDSLVRGKKSGDDRDRDRDKRREPSRDRDRDRARRREAKPS